MYIPFMLKPLIGERRVTEVRYIKGVVARFCSDIVAFCCCVDRKICLLTVPVRNSSEEHLIQRLSVFEYLSTVHQAL
jgi:hypothetical protein